MTDRKRRPEYVRDYPRPPRMELTDRRLQVEFGGRIIADTTRGYRILETTHPPEYYFPPEDVDESLLSVSRWSSFCEWKGQASYCCVGRGEDMVRDAVWYYPDPNPPYRAIAGYFAFYPGLMDACYVDGEPVVPQPGVFYGGWITQDVIGPFKKR